MALSLALVVGLLAVFTPQSLPAKADAAADAAANLADFQKMELVDDLHDLSKIVSVKYTKGLAIKAGAADDPLYLPNDAALWLDSENYQYANELTWEVRGNAAVGLAAYYNAMLTGWGTPSGDTRIQFYTSPDRLTWTPVADTDVSISSMGIYTKEGVMSHILWRYHVAETPQYTKYIKAVLPAKDSQILVTEVRQSGGKSESAYAVEFSDPIDTSFTPSAKDDDHVYFNQTTEWNSSCYGPGDGEPADYRRDDGRMGAARTYWPENDDTPLYVEYHDLPAGAKVTVETYMFTDLWKKDAKGIVQTGELRDDLKPYGAFKILVWDAQGNKWVDAGAVSQAYAGVGKKADGTYATRGYTKVIYGIGAMPEGCTKLRIEFPNYNRTGIDIKGNAWTVALKSVKAELPISIGEGDIADAVKAAQDAADAALAELAKAQAANAAAKDSTLAIADEQLPVAQAAANAAAAQWQIAKEKADYVKANAGTDEQELVALANAALQKAEKAKTDAKNAADEISIHRGNTVERLKFEAMDLIDPLDDLSKLQSVKYRKGLAVRKGADVETNFKSNDNALYLDGSTYQLVNELTWKVNGEASLALAAYYDYNNTEGWVAPAAGKALKFYTSPDRLNWTAVPDDQVTVSRIGVYGIQPLLAFWISKTPKYTQYLKVEVPATGSNVFITELRQSGGNATVGFTDVFYDPLDTTTKAIDMGNVVYLRDDGTYDPGAGEVADHRRADGKMGALRTYWPEGGSQEQTYVDYKLPGNARIVVETYVQDVVWKQNASGLPLTGELRDDLQDIGLFQFYTYNADSAKWEPIQTKQQVYPGVGKREDGTYALRGYDKVIYWIDQMPADRALLRVVFPNFNTTAVKEDIRTQAWIPSIKSVRADIPVSGLPEATVEEGALADIPVFDDGSSLEKVRPSILEDVVLRAASSAYSGLFDTNDAVMGRVSVTENSSLDWTIPSKAKIALITYYSAAAMNAAGTAVKDGMQLKIQTGEDRFGLTEANAKIQVLGRVGEEGYYKVAYVLDETTRYHRLLRVTYPNAGGADDIFLTTLRVGGGSDETNPRYKTIVHDPLKDDSVLYDKDGFFAFIFEEKTADADIIPPDDIDCLYIYGSSVGNYVMWEAKPGARVTFKAHYNGSTMWAMDENGYRLPGKLNAEQLDYGTVIEPIIYASADGEDWEEVTYRTVYEPAYRVTDGEAGPHHFDFAYFRVDNLPDDAQYVIFEFPDTYQNVWDFKLYDVLVEEDSEWTPGQSEGSTTAPTTPTTPDGKDPTATTAGKPEDNGDDATKTGDAGRPLAVALLAVGACGMATITLRRRSGKHRKTDR